MPTTTTTIHIQLQRYAYIFCRNVSSTQREWMSKRKRCRVKCKKKVETSKRTSEKSKNQSVYHWYGIHNIDIYILKEQINENDGTHTHTHLFSVSLSEPAGMMITNEVKIALMAFNLVRIIFIFLHWFCVSLPWFWFSIFFSIAINFPLPPILFY